jgi:hypothetical protein
MIASKRALIQELLRMFTNAVNILSDARAGRSNLSFRRPVTIRLLRQQGYSRPYVENARIRPAIRQKTLTVKSSHPDRDAQFEHINEEAKKAVACGCPVLSIDAKKKENLGNFKNGGKTYRPHKSPTEVLDHDFPLPELGKATPFGVYLIPRLKHTKA